MNVTYVYPGDNVTYNHTVTDDPFADFLPRDLYFHPHWRQYKRQIENIPDAVHYAFGLYIAFAGIFGVIGNGIVIWIFCKTKSLRTPPNVFVINLALSDLSFSAINGFPLTSISEFQKVWSWGNVACQLYAFFGGVFGLNSINTLALIAIDRYTVIAKPFYAMKHVSMKRSFMQLSVVYVLSVMWCIPPFFGFGAWIPEGFHTSCSFDYLTRSTKNMIFNHALFWGGFVAPVTVIACCYIGIIRAVSSQSGMMRKTAEKMGDTTGKTDKEKKQEMELAKLAAITISLFMVSWLPYAIVAQLGIWGMRQYVTPYTCQIPVLFAKSSALWNPIMYALNHPRFRAALEENVPWLVVCKSRKMDRGNEEKSGADTKRTVGNDKRAEQSSDNYDATSMCSVVSESVDITETRKENGASETRVSKGHSVPPRHQPPPTTEQRQNSFYIEHPTPNRSSSLSRTAGAAMHKLAEAYDGLRRLRDGGGQISNLSFQNPSYKEETAFSSGLGCAPLAFAIPTPVFLPQPHPVQVPISKDSTPHHSIYSVPQSHYVYPPYSYSSFPNQENVHVPEVNTSFSTTTKSQSAIPNDSDIISATASSVASIPAVPNNELAHRVTGESTQTMTAEHSPTEVSNANDGYNIPSTQIPIGDINAPNRIPTDDPTKEDRPLEDTTFRSEKEGGDTVEKTREEEGIIQEPATGSSNCTDHSPIDNAGTTSTESPEDILPSFSPTDRPEINDTDDQTHSTPPLVRKWSHGYAQDCV